LIEPNEKVWPNIRAIWEANNLKLPHQLFVGFASNETKLPHVSVEDIAKHNPDWPECAFGPVIGDHGFKQLKDAGDIPQIRIDDMPGRKPTAIILDVEGSEWEVLKGAEQTLRLHKPKIWLSGHPEFMFDQYGQYLGDLRKWIKDIGYQEKLIDYQHEVHLLYTEAQNG
jgi:FkbM family methyltransferase